MLCSNAICNESLQSHSAVAVCTCRFSSITVVFMMTVTTVATRVYLRFNALKIQGYLPMSNLLQCSNISHPLRIRRLSSVGFRASVSAVTTNVVGHCLATVSKLFMQYVPMTKRQCQVAVQKQSKGIVLSKAWRKFNRNNRCPLTWTQVPALPNPLPIKSYPVK